MKSILIAVVLMSLVGCLSTKQTNTLSRDAIGCDKAVNVQVTGLSAHSNISAPISQDILNTLSREIKGQLIISGFDLAEHGDDAIYLHVDVSVYKAGNQALRVLVGFGAGRASLIYTAQYKDVGGNVLATMNGQERLTGMEISYNQNYGGTTSLGGADTAIRVLTKEAAKHIVELATTDYNAVEVVPEKQHSKRGQAGRR